MKLVPVWEWTGICKIQPQRQLTSALLQIGAPSHAEGGNPLMYLPVMVLIKFGAGTRPMPTAAD